MTKPAFLAIDLVNDYFRDGPLHDQKRAIVDSVNQLSNCFRDRNYPVIWIRQEFSKDLSDAFLEMRREGIHITIAGTEGAMLLPELEQSLSDHEMIKKRYSAFFGTELDRLIDKLQLNPLVLGGVNTHACIRMTAIDAYQRDLDVIVASDCVSSYDEEHHRITMNYLDRKIAAILSNQEIEELLHGWDDEIHAAQQLAGGDAAAPR